VILRVIRGRAGRDQLETLRATLESQIDRAADDHAPIRLHVAARPSGDDCEAAIFVVWRAAEDVARADRRGESPLAVGRRLGIDLEPMHFEVDESIQRQSLEEPVAIRLANGRFSRIGTDIEMLDLLRQRVPLVGDDMTEAYVGRRLVDRMVDVTFVSAWRRLPADRPLDQVFWPDIALRYDSFSVDVFTPVKPPTAVLT
jgi:hypothetical protein